MEKVIRKAAKCYLIKENQVVITRYKSGNKKEGYYDIPGGKIEEGELPKQTAIREMKEETGLQVENLTHKGKMLIEDKKIEAKHHKLIQKAIDIMKAVDDPKHSFCHMMDVVEYTKEILKEVEADPEVCIIAAYWHDTGRIQQKKGHALISANLLKQEMELLGYDSDIINKCYKAIYKHSWKEEPETIEGIIVRDADKIDFVGGNRWIECIQNNCRFNKTLELLPKAKNDLLRLDVSKKIFERELYKLVILLHNEIFLK